MVKTATKDFKYAFEFAGEKIKKEYPTLEKFIEDTKEKIKSKEMSKEKPTRSRGRSKGNER